MTSRETPQKRKAVDPVLLSRNSEQSEGEVPDSEAEADVQKALSSVNLGVLRDEWSYTDRVHCRSLDDREAKFLSALCRIRSSLPSLTLRKKDGFILLPEEMWQFTSLRDLSFECSSVTWKHSAPLRTMVSVKNLTIRCPDLEHIPAILDAMPNLTSLDLECPSLRELPECLGRLTQLKVLDLSKCRSLHRLPASFVDLQSLESLILCSSGLIHDGILDHITALTSLQELDLHRKFGSTLTALPEGFCSLTNLTRLDLGGSSVLRELPKYLGRLTQLKVLDLSECRSLDRLPASFVDLQSLESLILCSSGLIRDGILDHITALTSLQELDLSKQRGDEDGSTLTALPEGFCSLTNLARLDLSNNTGLSELPWALGLNSNLDNLVISGCGPFRAVPSFILEKGGRAVLKFLKDLTGGGKPCNTVKVVLVGEHRAGKSSLVKSLIAGQAKRCHQDDRTVGIDVWRWRPGSQSKREFLVNVYDAAGHRVYRASHGLFMSDEALYLNVVSADGTESEIFHRLLLWVEIVQQFVPVAKMAIVFTHLDVCRPGTPRMVMRRLRDVLEKETLDLDRELKCNDGASLEEKISVGFDIALKIEGCTPGLEGQKVAWQAARDKRDRYLRHFDRWSFSGCKYEGPAIDGEEEAQDSDVESDIDLTDDDLEEHDSESGSGADSPFVLDSSRMLWIRDPVFTFSECSDCGRPFGHAVSVKKSQVQLHWDAARCVSCKREGSGKIVKKLHALHDRMSEIEKGLEKTLAGLPVGAHGSETDEHLPPLTRLNQLRQERLRRCRLLFCTGTSCETYLGGEELQYDLEVVLRSKHLFPKLGQPQPLTYALIGELIRQGQLKVWGQERDTGESSELESELLEYAKLRAKGDTAAAANFQQFRKLVEQPFCRLGELSQPAEACGIAPDELRRAVEFLHHTGSLLLGSELKRVWTGSSSNGEGAVPTLDDIVFCHSQWLIDAIKYVIREREEHDVNGELRQLDDEIRKSDCKYDLDLFLLDGTLSDDLLREHLWGRPLFPSPDGEATRRRKFKDSDMDVLVEVLKRFRLLREGPTRGAPMRAARTKHGTKQGETYVVPAMMDYVPLPAEFTKPLWLPTASQRSGCVFMRRLYRTNDRMLPFGLLGSLQTEWARMDVLDKNCVMDPILSENGAGSVLCDRRPCDDGVSMMTEFVVVSTFTSPSPPGEWERRRDELRVMAWIESPSEGHTEWPLFQRVCESIEKESKTIAGLFLSGYVPYVDADGTLILEVEVERCCRGASFVKIPVGDSVTRVLHRVRQELLWPCRIPVRVPVVKGHGEAASLSQLEVDIFGFFAREYDADEEEEALKLDIEAQKIMRVVNFKVGFQFFPHTAPAVADLFAQLQCCDKRAAPRPMVLHLAGHGTKNSGFIWGKNEDGTRYSSPEAKNIIVDFLGTYAPGPNREHGVECVFLNACDMLDMGKGLIGKQIPHVVCWCTEVDDDVACDFSEHFYKQLVTNDQARDYRAAFQRAVQAMGGALREGTSGRRPTPLSNEREYPGRRNWIAFLEQGRSAVEVRLGPHASTGRLWRPVQGKRDFSAQAGQAERRCLAALGFSMEFNGRDIQEGNGLDGKGQVLEAVLRSWGVQRYTSLWGSGGKVVETATALRSSGRAMPREALQCVKEAVQCREQDMANHERLARNCDCIDSSAAACRACKSRQAHQHELRIMQDCSKALELLLPSQAQTLALAHTTLGEPSQRALPPTSTWAAPRVAAAAPEGGSDPMDI